MKHKSVQKTVLAALFLAVGMILPLLTGQIKEIGDSLLPMHLPVLLCGGVCGPFWGGIIGLVLPFFRSFLFSMPPLYPNAVWMAAELCAYGVVFGVLYQKIPRRSFFAVYLSLVPAMVAGRLCWGGVKALLLSIADKPFPFSAFLIGGFADAVPGIILQLILIPLLLKVFEKIKI
jgi:hypothetical protein